jgi:hypothetical protein
VSARRLLATILVVAGLLLLVAAVLYFAVPAKSLPSILGDIPGNDVHRWKRGTASLVVALACLFGGALVTRRSPGTSA